jgi:hypothetical protein
MCIGYELPQSIQMKMCTTQRENVVGQSQLKLVI